MSKASETLRGIGKPGHELTRSDVGGDIWSPTALDPLAWRLCQTLWHAAPTIEEPVWGELSEDDREFYRDAVEDLLSWRSMVERFFRENAIGLRSRETGHQIVTAHPEVCK